MQEYIKTENGYDFYTEDEEIIRKKKLYTKWSKIAYACAVIFGITLATAMVCFGVNIHTYLVGNDTLALWIIGGICGGSAVVTGLLGGFSIHKMYCYHFFYIEYEKSEEYTRRVKEIEYLKKKECAEKTLERVDRVLEVCEMLGGENDKSDNG